MEIRGLEKRVEIVGNRRMGHSLPDIEEIMLTVEHAEGPRSELRLHRGNVLGPVYVQQIMADVTDATFETDVVERSRTVPVVIDLWAEWCGPCKQLGPMIEKVVAETNGAVELAKVDVDANKEVAGAFKVQSIPAVYAMVDGKIVDGFMGAQPEQAVRDFVAKLVPPTELSEIDQLVEASDEASLRAALEIESDYPAAVVALAALLIEQDAADEASALLERIPESADTRRLLALARTGAPTADLDDELAALLANVKDDEVARQRFVDLLEVMGSDDPRTAGWRRRLSAALF